MTIDGELNWQNQLNEKNKPFFDLCDGIFVNYTWTVSSLFSVFSFSPYSLELDFLFLYKSFI